MATGPQRGVAYAAIAASLIAPAEGLWLTAKIDRVGTGQPPTVCYGMTSADRPVRVGDKYTPEQCMAFLLTDIPKYAAPIIKCIHVAVSDHFLASVTSGGYNAGARAACNSPMVARINEDPDNVEYACQAFIGPDPANHPEKGWYVTARHKYLPGLANRRMKEYKVCITKDAA